MFSHNNSNTTFLQLMSTSLSITTDLRAANAYNLIAQSVDVHGEGNFFQGCSFSPDGLCVLTTTVADGVLRLYNTVTSPLILSNQEDAEKDRGTDHSIENTKQVPTAVVQDWTTVLSSSGGESVRCYSWFPLMNSSDPATCCFLAASRDQPVHLYDAYNADHVRASYRPYNSLDEMEAPNVSTFSHDGQRIVCAGFRTDRTIHVFDTAVPGRDSTVLRLGKTRRSSDGQKGLVSSISFSGASSIFAVGTYAPGSIYLYDLRSSPSPSGTILNGHCVVGHGRRFTSKKRRFTQLESNEDTNVVQLGDGDAEQNDLNSNNWFSLAKAKWFQSKTQSGVTQLQFAPNDEFILFSASRRSNAIIAWDIRMLSGQPEYQTNPIRGIATCDTVNNTNQRLEFDIDSSGQTLYAGGQDNCVRIFDIKSGRCTGIIGDLDDSANGVSTTRINGNKFIAITTGSRRFETFDEQFMDSGNQIDRPGYLRIYGY